MKILTWNITQLVRQSLKWIYSLFGKQIVECSEKSFKYGYCWNEQTSNKTVKYKDLSFNLWNAMIVKQCNFVIILESTCVQIKTAVF